MPDRVYFDRRGPHCMCESSLCDHGDADRLVPCTRPVDSRLMMSYVIHTCTQCAANMAATGGGCYIHLHPTNPQEV